MVKRRRLRQRQRGRRGGRRNQRMFNGGLVRGQMHPRTVSAAPWNRLNLVVFWKLSDAKAGLACIGMDQVRGQLLKELGLTSVVAMRVTRVDIWVPPARVNSDNNYIAFAPCDWSLEETCQEVRPLTWYEAWGTAVQPAHLHYVWPRSLSVRVAIGNSAYTLFQLDLKDGNMSYLMRFSVQWRAATPDPRPTVKGIFDAYRGHMSEPPDDWNDIMETPVQPLSGMVANCSL